MSESSEFPTTIANLSFAFGPEHSIASHLMPAQFIRDFTGRSPREFFGYDPPFTSPTRAITGFIAEGRYQVGVIKADVYESSVRRGWVDPKICRVIWRSPPYPGYRYHFMAHPRLVSVLGTDYVAKLRSAFVDCDQPELLSILGFVRFRPLENSEFDELETTARELGVLEWLVTH